MLTVGDERRGTEDVTGRKLTGRIGDTREFSAITGKFSQLTLNFFM